MSALRPKLAVARAVGSLVRASGRGGGTSLPGKILLRLEPDAIGSLTRRLVNGCAVISATNGKTTTAAMAATILEGAGHRLVHNRAGANMAGGVAATLLAAAGGGDRIDGDLGLFEVDEFWVAQLTAQAQPRVLLLANLFRDQLDRYGELETIAERWAQVVGRPSGGRRLVLNADDPLIADLGRERSDVTYFGVEDQALAVPQMQHASDSKHCRRCGAPYVYDAIYLGHLGDYHCPVCGQQRPRPTVYAQEVNLYGTRRSSFTLTTPAGARPVALALPGLYNVYNAVAAAALCLELGVQLDQVVSGLQAATAPFGRAEEVTVAGGSLKLLLMKNPAGANELLRTLALEPGELDLLAILNDLIADGRDVSWIWDADFELLVPHLRRVVCAGTRAAEMAVRLKYAGVDPSRLTVIPELSLALDSAFEGAPDGRVFVLPTYTALLALREELAGRGHVSPYWEQPA
jgi:UDP-N-acetylmuramyl tripeptide synthase